MADPTSSSLTAATEFDADYAAEQIRRTHHPLRAFIKGFYLRRMLRMLEGPTLDFGCGAGQLLQRLPPGSAGIELNPHLVKHLCSRGLTVHAAQGDMSDFDLHAFRAGQFHSLVIAHVLEHLPNPEQALRTLLAACRRIGIRRVLVIVPGLKGFESDATHKVFIDADWMETHIPSECNGFRRAAPAYYPGNSATLGPLFIYHEMQVVFEAL